jgi:L-fuconolactonase
MTVLDAFGYDRVVFGGNWFVVKTYSTYKRWASVLVDILTKAGVGSSQMRKLFHDNAEKYYRL